MEYFEEIDVTFKDFLTTKEALFPLIKSQNLLEKLSVRFDNLYSQFDFARGSCTQALYKRCQSLIDDLDENLNYAQKELRGVAEALYSKTSSPHKLMERLKVCLVPAVRSDTTVLAMAI